MVYAIATNSEWRKELPENFAAQTAALAEAELRAASDRLEMWLQRALILALIVSAVVAVVLVGSRVLTGLAEVAGKEWLYTIAVCFGLSAALQRWMKGPSPSR